MEEETDSSIRQALAQEPRYQEQLVIVHPDQVTRLVLLRHDIGEPLVHLHVGVPVAHVKRYLIEEIVKEGPEDPVREALVLAGDLIGSQGDRHQAHGGQLLV